MKIEYNYNATTRRIELPIGAPFDGKPVLVKFAIGWCEARWEAESISETQNGREVDGFCWVLLDDSAEQQELDDAQEWLPLPGSAIEINQEVLFALANTRSQKGWDSLADLPSTLIALVDLACDRITNATATKPPASPHRTALAQGFPLPWAIGCPGEPPLLQADPRIIEFWGKKMR